LKNCKALCDKLIVGVLTDEATMERKSKPIISFEDRIHIVASIRYVDSAVTQETYSPELNVHSLKPDILFESTSHVNPFFNPYGKTLLMPYYPKESSTNIKSRLMENYYA